MSSRHSLRNIWTKRCWWTPLRLHPLSNHASRSMPDKRRGPHDEHHHRRLLQPENPLVARPSYSPSNSTPSAKSSFPWGVAAACPLPPRTSELTKAMFLFVDCCRRCKPVMQQLVDCCRRCKPRAMQHLVDYCGAANEMAEGSLALWCSNIWSCGRFVMWAGLQGGVLVVRGGWRRRHYNDEAARVISHGVALCDISVVHAV